MAYDIESQTPVICLAKEGVVQTKHKLETDIKYCRNKNVYFFMQVLDHMLILRPNDISVSTYDTRDGKIIGKPQNLKNKLVCIDPLDKVAIIHSNITGLIVQPFESLSDYSSGVPQIDDSRPTSVHEVNILKYSNAIL